MKESRNVLKTCFFSCLPIVIFVFVRLIDGSEVTRDELTFCSFFNNRAPSPQPSLMNCTWFSTNSCCKQEEIEATFGTVKPLPGSTTDCQRYTNYLMCYICAPFQNRFYRQERLTVCEEFCNVWYSACSSAILKGSMIGGLYRTGREFCEKRNYQCEPMESQQCFTFDAALDKKSGSTCTDVTWSCISIATFASIIFTRKNHFQS